MRWRSAEVRAAGAGAIVSLAGGVTEGFAAARAAVAAVAGGGKITGEGLGDGAGVGEARSQFTNPVVGVDVFSRFPPGLPKVRSYRKMRSTTRSRAFRVYCGNSRVTLAACMETTGASQATKTPMERNAIVKSARIAFVLPNPCSVIFVTKRSEEIGEDDGDRHWNQDRLKEPDYLGRDPDDRAYDRNEQDHTNGGQGSPHRFLLPGCGIFCHSLKNQAAA